MLELSSPSQTAPLRTSLVGQNTNITSFSSQKKKRKSTSIVGPSLDEENAPNRSTNIFADFFKKSDQCITKLLRINRPIEDNAVNDSEATDQNSENSTPANPSNNDNNTLTMTDYTIPTINTDTENLKLSCSSPNVSECGTELSSVSERRAWLKNFEKKQASNAFRSMTKDEEARDNDDRNNHETRHIDTNKTGRESPPAPSMISSAHTNSGVSSAINLPASLHTSAVISSAKKPRKPKPVINRRASSSVMMQSRMGGRKEEVKATDDGHASVASLSKWLEADPTSAKKKRHVRRGRNIISKSRQYEKDNEVVIIMESQISRGAVGNKKKWLQNAFQSTIEEDGEDDACSTYSGYVKSEVGRSVGSYPRYNRQGAQTEIITNDAASNLSVADKKDWLKKAFVKNSEERKKLGYTATQTDVMHNRGEPRDEAASRAKLRFKERSARKLMGATTYTRPSGKPAPSSSSTNSDEGDSRISPKEKAWIESEKASTIDPKESIFRSAKVVQMSDPVEEDPMGFRAARAALVQRSKKNGHKTQVVNKVFLRKKKFEKLEETSRRNSIGVGLVLKPSWETVDTSKGCPSTAYEKKYVPASDIAPKKSFEELP